MENKLNSALNTLLSSYQIHYQNLRGLHWNIKGENFFELHTKYEELYNQAQINIDEIAERILMRSSQPMHSFADYIKHSKIKELPTTPKGNKGVQYIVSGLETLLKLERKILSISSELDDEATSALISDLIREHEKTNWMFSSWLAK